MADNRGSHHAVSDGAIDPMGPPFTVTADEAAAQAMHLLHRLLHQRRAGESVKAAIARAATGAGLSFERAREIWYGRAKVMAHEMMQMQGRVAQREARVARLLDRLAGMAGEPGAPVRPSQLAAALDLAEIIPGVEPWARSLSAAARALVVVCLLSMLPALLISQDVEARTVKRGGPAAVKLMRGAAKAGRAPAGPAPHRVIFATGVRHA